MINVCLMHCSPDAYGSSQRTSLPKIVQVAELVISAVLAVMGTLAFSYVVPLPGASFPTMVAGWSWFALAVLAIVLCRQQRVAAPEFQPKKPSAPSSQVQRVASTQRKKEASSASSVRPLIRTSRTSHRAASTATASRPHSAATPCKTDTAMREELQRVLDEAFAYIDRGVSETCLLNIALTNESVAEIRERLKNDFRLVEKWEEYSLDVKLTRVKQMREALPYFLADPAVSTSASNYPLLGIRNYTGTNCFLNADLQCLTHSRRGDYALLRPMRVPEEIFFMENDGSDTYLQYLQYKQARQDLIRRVKKINKVRPYVWGLVEGMRKGKIPSATQMSNLRKLLEYTPTGYNDWGLLLKYALMGVEVNRLNQNGFLVRGTSLISDIERLFDMQQSVFLYHCPGHFVAIVRHSSGLYKINDSVVSSTTIEKICKDLQKDAQNLFSSPGPPQEDCLPE